MDMGSFTFFLKRIKEDYGLNESEVAIVKNRLLADSTEFESVLKLFNKIARGSVGGKDQFGERLKELMAQS